jgi:hypothetical protein
MGGHSLLEEGDKEMLGNRLLRFDIMIVSEMPTFFDGSSISTHLEGFENIGHEGLELD